ncbi:MAG: hypothetical protein ACPGO5_01495 [Patescibacteria group bacterium]
MADKKRHKKSSGETMTLTEIRTLPAAALKKFLVKLPAGTSCSKCSVRSVVTYVLKIKRVRDGRMTEVCQKRTSCEKHQSAVIKKMIADFQSDNRLDSTKYYV